MEYKTYIIIASFIFIIFFIYKKYNNSNYSNSNSEINPIILKKIFKNDKTLQNLLVEFKSSESFIEV